MTQQSYTIESADTREVAPFEQLDYWRALLADYQCRLSMITPTRKSFTGRASRQRTATYQLIGWTSEGSAYRRSRQDIRVDPDGDYRLTFPGRGVFRLGPGDNRLPDTGGGAALFNMATPFILRHRTGAEGFALTIPRREIEQRIGDLGSTLTPIDLRLGLGRVIADMATGLVDERHRITAAQFDAVCDRVVELLCMLAVGDDSPTSRSHLAEVESSIRRYVREHADDPDLDGHTVAAALGWSVRQIQLALQQAGTSPRRLIKEERLARAMEHLRNPGPRQLTITDLAHRHGFSSLSSFSNAFRERYGYSPSAARADRP